MLLIASLIQGMNGLPILPLGIRMIFEKEMDKRVVVWARYTWEDALTQATTLVSALMWFPILTLIPLRAAQNLPWRGIRSFIQEDLIADWKNKLSLALLTFPAELCHMETIEEYLYGRFLASPEEEEEEEDPLLYAQEDDLEVSDGPTVIRNRLNLHSTSTIYRKQTSEREWRFIGS